MTSLPTALDPASAGSVPRSATPPTSMSVPRRFAPIAALLDEAEPGTRLALARPSFRGLPRDPLFLLSLALVVPVLAMELVVGSRNPLASAVASGGFLAAQAAFGQIRAARSPVLLLRFGLCMAYVALANWALLPAMGTVMSLEVPIVALAAAAGGPGLVIVWATLALNLLPVLFIAVPDDVRRELLALTMASGVTSIGTRRVVTALERSRDRLRRSQILQRRRARQLTAVEAVGRILTEEGPTGRALDSVVGLLVETFGYRYPSIYTWDGKVLRLGAQRNYEAPIEEFPTTKGVIGRAARTREPVFLADVSTDPDYVSADAGIQGEISIPMLSAGDLLGVLNVEMPGPRRLDSEDFATLQIVADRLAVGLALGRERQKLTERARLMDALVAFSRNLGGSLDPVTVTQRAAAGAARVIEAEMLTVIVGEQMTGEFRVVQVEGGDPRILGIEVVPGDGVSGRALLEGKVIVVDRQELTERPKAARNIRMAEALAAMSAPMRLDDRTIGALTWVREDLDRAFSEQEQEVAALLAAQVALAIANAELHHATEVRAVTDALTGLANRRHFDASVIRAEAARARESEGERRPLAAVIFDLDHFGQVNKLHGHQVGDRILAAFGEVLRARVRKSDLVARYGGEEFVAILDGATRSEATHLADEVRQAFETLRFALPDGAQLAATVSAGCAALGEEETSFTTLIERSDVGLAMAKASGRNRVVAA
jgi:diguanylate cyclase (GGDEF)-like protein